MQVVLPPGREEGRGDRQGRTAPGSLINLVTRGRRGWGRAGQGWAGMGRAEQEVANGAKGAKGARNGPTADEAHCALHPRRVRQTRPSAVARKLSPPHRVPRFLLHDEPIRGPGWFENLMSEEAVISRSGAGVAHSTIDEDQTRTYRAGRGRARQSRAGRWRGVGPAEENKGGIKESLAATALFMTSP